MILEEVRKLTYRDLVSRIEHTVLRPNAGVEAVRRACMESIEHGFHGCCVPPWLVKEASEILSGTQVRVVTVAGFPLGNVPVKTKVFELREAAAQGAQEVDVVVNVSAVRSGMWDYVRDEVSELVDAAREVGCVLKLIVETSLLSDDEVRRLSGIAVDLGVDFIKTNTGFGPRGVTVHDVIVIKEATQGRARIKAAGGIRHVEDAVALIMAGADRIGTSSGVEIAREFTAYRQ